MSVVSRALPERIATPRLVLRGLRPEDAPLLFDAYMHEDYAPRYVRWPPHQQVSETVAFVAKALDASLKRQLLPYVLTLRGEEQLPIGMLEGRPRGTTMDVGFVLARSRWGHGLMAEAVRAFTDAALVLPEVWRVQAVCDVENRASVRTLEKAGFAREGRLARYVSYPRLSPEPRDCYMFARCKA